MRDEIERFVASLRIPAARKAVVLAELLDHAASAGEAARRAGRDDAGEAARRAGRDDAGDPGHAGDAGHAGDPGDAGDAGYAGVEAAVREAIGDLEALRASYEAAEAGFGVSRRQAFVRGMAAAAIVAVALDQGAPALHALGMGMATARTWSAGLGGAVFALVVAVAFAPRHLLEMLRGELRAPAVRGRLGRGVPIGAAATYLYTVMTAPFVVWIAMIVVRAFGGMTEVDAPLSAFSLTVPVYALLAVEGIRARAYRVAG